MQGNRELNNLRRAHEPVTGERACVRGVAGEEFGATKANQ